MLCIIRNYLIFAAMLVLAGANCRYQKTIDEKGENENLVRLVKALDSDDWAARESASRQIMALGPAYVAGLRAFEKGCSIEQKSRLGEIILAMEKGCSIEHSRRLNALIDELALEVRRKNNRNSEERNTCEQLPRPLLELLLNGKVALGALRNALVPRSLPREDRHLLLRCLLTMEGEESAYTVGSQLPLLVSHKDKFFYSWAYEFIEYDFSGCWKKVVDGMKATALSTNQDPAPHIKNILRDATFSSRPGAIESVAIEAVKYKKIRGTAIKYLGYAGTGRAKQVVLQFLDSDDFDVKKAAIDALIRANAREHLNLIMAALKGIPDDKASEMWEVWGNLTRWLDEGTVKEFLAGKAKSAERQDIKHYAMLALSSSGRNEYFPFIELLLEKGVEEIVREEALLLLPRFGGSEKVLSQFRKVLASGSSDLKNLACFVFAEMDGPQVVQMVVDSWFSGYASANDKRKIDTCLLRNARHLKERDIMRLLERDSTEKVGLGIVAKLKDDRFTPIINKIALVPWHPEAGYFFYDAVSTLRSIGSQEAIDALLKIGKSGNDTFAHFECLKALENSPRRSECSWIKTFLRNKPRYLRAQALRALAAISPEDAVEQCKNIVEMSDENGKPEAITLLGLLPSRLTDEILNRLWQKGDKRQKVAVARAYMMQDNPKALDVLTELCSKRGNYVRIAVTYGRFNKWEDFRDIHFTSVYKASFLEDPEKDIEITIEFDAALWAMHMLRKIVPCAKDLVYTESEESWQSKLAKVRNWSEANRGKTSFQTDENTPWW